MNSTVAVIVPFYNAADTLPRLVDALKAQTHPEFIAYFVDDGSIDGGRAYITDISGEDSRFMVLNGNHSGPGSARNVGLEQAERLGFEYVTFVDADDIPLPTMLEEALAAFDGLDADIVHYQWNSEIGGNPHKDSLKGAPSIYVWNKLYRLSAIVGIRFLDVKFAEDLAFFLETETRHPKRIAIDKPLYCHVRHQNSLWENRSPADIAHAMRTVIERLDLAMRTSHPALRRRWQRFYMVKLLKIWKKSLDKNLREVRSAAIMDYVDFVSNIRFPGFTAMRFRFKHAVFVFDLRIKWWLKNISQGQEMRYVRKNYANVRRRIAALPTDRKIRIFFHVTEVSKWKCQTVYDQFKASAKFEPFVLVDLAKQEYCLDGHTRNAVYVERRKWFADRGMAFVDGYDISRREENDIKTYSPDVVFYQQPWGIRDSMSALRVSRYALTCYVPYYVSNYSNPNFDCDSDFHKTLTYYMVMSSSFAASFQNALRGVPYVCEFVPVGHPALDTLLQPSLSVDRTDKVVIYAPHWTFHMLSRSTLCCYGTFEWSGEAILDFAERHPEICWCFKPHPLLRDSLVEYGFYTNAQVETYYSRWKRIGSVCMDADYAPIFLSSAAMITDCGSFLTEYSMTGKPIVHLLSSHNSLQPVECLKELYGTFYGVHNNKELLKILDTVILQGIDVNANVRREALKHAGLADGRPSSCKILSFLEEKLVQHKTA